MQEMNAYKKTLDCLKNQKQYTKFWKSNVKIWLLKAACNQVFPKRYQNQSVKKKSENDTRKMQIREACESRNF